MAMSKRAIPQKESIGVEFKSEPKPLPDSELIDTIVALSNTEGGTLYLGVDDSGTPTGVHPKHADPIQLAAFIANKTNPPVAARVSTLNLDNEGCESTKGAKVLAIEVPRSQAIIATSEGKITRRRLKADGSPETTPLYPYEIITRLSSLGQLDYSAFPLPDATMDDFSPDEIIHLRLILNQNSSGDKTLLELSDEEVLAALQMTRLVDGKQTPTVTGILLAGKSEAINRVMPTSKAVFQVLEGTEVRANIDLDGPLLSTIERIRELLDPWNPEREIEFGLFRESVPEFDRRAFREALVNAFGHRDYASLGSVRVLIDDEGLTISNPGGFIEGVTLKNLLTVDPHGRNETLMNALKRIGLAEKTGRGVDRIFEGSLIYGKPLPDYSGSTAVSVRVFIARGKPDVEFMRMIDDEQSRLGKTLSLRSLLVLDRLKEQRRLTINDLSDQLNYTEPTIRTTVEELVETGLVEAWGGGKSRSYTLSSSVYKVAGKDIGFVHQTDIDRIRYEELILKLASQQNGIVSTKDIEELLHISHRQAHRQIVKLIEEGKLIQVGKGRASRYALTE